MLIEKTCRICGAKFTVPHWRDGIAKFCSVDCRQKSLRAEPNVICSNCGKPFHMKEYRMKRTNRDMGYFCSKKCFGEYRKVWFRGENNHQYGLRGNLNASFKGEELLRKNNTLQEIEAYAPYRVDADKRGRVTKHRLLVEENWQMFNADAFYVVNDQHVLRNGYDVHHKDGNHGNNDLSNLEILTRGEHVKLHNKHKQIIRDPKTGRITGVIKIQRP